MSASVQTAAKPRGRRDSEASEKRSGSRASSSASLKLSKPLSRTLEEMAIPWNSRPNSPAVRNRTIDSKSSDLNLISSKSSAASIKTDRMSPTREEDENPSTADTLSKSKLETISASGEEEYQSDSSVPKETAVEICSSEPGQPLVDPPTTHSPVESSSSLPPSTQPEVMGEGEEASATIHSDPAPSTALSPVPLQESVEDGQAHVSTLKSSSPVLNNDGRPRHEGPSPAPAPRTPTKSRPPSPIIHQYGPSHQDQFQYAYGYPAPIMSGPPLQTGLYPTPFTSPIAPSVQSHANVRTSTPSSDDDPYKLLEKVTSALPDINRLLHYYQESQRLLSAKDVFLKQEEARHADEVTNLQIELHATKEEYEKFIGELASDNVKLKSEVDEQIASLAVITRERDEAREALDEWQSKYKELSDSADAMRLLKDQLLSEKTELEKELDDVKKQGVDEREAHARTLAELEVVHKNALEEHATLATELKTNLSKLQLDLANLLTKHAQQKKDLDTARSEASEHERLLGAKSKELDDVRESHQQEMADTATQHKLALEARLKELADAEVKHQEAMSALTSAHEQEQNEASRAAAARTAALVEEHRQREQSQQNEIDSLKAEVEAGQHEMSREKEQHEALKVEHDRTIGTHAELAQTLTSLKSMHAEWQKESEKMDRILQSLGHSKGGQIKGDQYFLNAFDRLAQSIEKMSIDFFQNPPSMHSASRSGSLAPDMPDMPDITGSTECARELRSLLAQHRMFEVLHRRIFRPFLFTTGDDGSDDCGLEELLTTISRMIRGKSVRREALWRAITLRAMFSSPRAKKSVNAAATATLNEIVEALTQLAPPERPDELLQALRAVVKDAVALWRQARVDPDTIRSSMPDTSHSHALGDVIFWVRPHVVCERTGILTAAGQDGEGEMGTLIYLQGTALRRDSPLILQRRQEVLQEHGGRDGG